MTGPLRCRHNSGTYPAEEIMDGQGHVIGRHHRCRECHIILRTEMW